jgi:hypothetical protein
MGETNSPSVAHVGYDISPLSTVKLKILPTLAWRLVVKILILTLLSGKIS